MLLTSIAIANPSFELPATSTYTAALPTGWTNASTAGTYSSIGVARVNQGGASGSWYTATPPDGSQAAYLQGTGGISQVLNFTVTANYTLSFSAMAQLATGGEAVNAYLDSTLINTWTPGTAAWQLEVATLASVTAGNHTLKFIGGQNALNKAVAIDNVSIVAAPSQTAFTTGTQSVGVGLTSTALSIELKDQLSNIVNAPTGGQRIILATTSTRGIFLDSNGNAITTITVGAGAATATFYYNDTTAGTPTITASAPGLTSATQIETIAAGESTYGNNGQPWLISANAVSWVEAENFDTGGEGVGYHNSVTTNAGGQYRPNEGIGVEGPNAATDNTWNIGYTNNGEWLQYTVHVAQSGQYQLDLRTSAAGTGGTAHVTFGGVNVTGALTIGGTGGWQTYQNVLSTVTLNADAGSQTVRIYVDANGFNIDYLSLTPIALITTPPAEQIYGGVRGLPTLVPQWGTATIQAENYDLGGQNVAYFKTNTTQNTHGSYTAGTPPVVYTYRATDYVSTAYLPYSTTNLAVISWNQGDWTQYTIQAAAAGYYEVLFNYAKSDNTAAAVTLSVNGVQQGGTFALPSTGSDTTYGAVPIVIQLAAGQNVLRVTSAAAGSFYLDTMQLTASTTFNNNNNSWYMPSSGTVHIQAVSFDVNPGAWYVPSPTTGGPANYRPGTGVYTETTTDSGSGGGAGYDVGLIQPGEYLNYTLRPTLEGRYNIAIRYLNPTGTGLFHIVFDGVDRTGVVVLPTATTWQTLTLSIVMTNDFQVMHMEGLAGSFSLNWIELAAASTTSTPAVLADPAQAGSYAQEPPSAALNSNSDLFNRVYDKQYDWINQPANAPVPTNDWWSQILESPFAGALWSYPLKLSDGAGGVGVSAYAGVTTTAGNIGFSGEQKITVDDASANASFIDDALVDYGDWTVHYRMQEAGTAYMDVTLAQGSPYSWFQFSGMTPVLTFASGFKLYNASGTQLTGTFTTDHFRIDSSGGAGTGPQFGLFAPTGTSFTLSSGKISFNGSPAYLIIAQLPDATSTTMSLFYSHAYALPNGSLYNWTYDPVGGKIDTTWNMTTQVLANAPAGSSSDTIQGWLPHNYEGILSSSNLTLLSGYQFANINGPIALSVGHAWEIDQPANTLAFELPAPAVMGNTVAGGVADYNSAQMLYYLHTDATQNASVPVYGGDTYWGGKDLQIYAEYALMAQQIGDTADYNTFVSGLTTALTDWFTYTPGETQHYFAYYPKDHALIGFNPAYGSENYTDNHFHYGYFTSAAGVLAMLNPTWGQQYGAMAEMVAKQYANWDRSDTRFPFLRTFDPWSGHSYAGGMGDARGDNQESTSEAMQSWQGLVLLGAALGDANMLAAGMMGYTIEAKAEQYYWFGTPSNPLPTGYNRSNVAILYTDSKSFATFFGANPEYVFGIENLPLWPSMEFNGEYPTIAANATSLLLSQAFTQDAVLTKAYPNATPSQMTFANWESADPGNTWINIALGYVQQYDPQAAAVELANEWTHQYGIATDPTAGIYYYQTQAHRTHGTRDWTLRLGPQAGDPTWYPLGGVYTNPNLASGTHTYIVYNPTNTAQVVDVYDANGNVVDHFTAAPHATTTALSTGGQLVPAVVLSPQNSSVAAGTNQQFTATVVDQLGHAIAGSPSIVWSLDAGSVGVISSTGLFTTSFSTNGTAIIRATSGTATAVWTVTVAPDPNYYSTFTSTNLTLTANNGSTLPAVQTGFLRLTDNTGGQRSAFYNTKVDVTNFVTNFTFRITGSGNMADGFTFTIQNSAVNALGGNNGNLAYTGISNSVCIKFDIYKDTGDPSANCVGLFTGGAAPIGGNSVDLTPSGITLNSGHTFAATISYDGANLSVTLTDTSTSKKYTTTWTNVDIPTLVGGNRAWVGFTGACGGFHAYQDILTWTWNRPQDLLAAVAPNPATSAVPSIAIHFNRPVSGLTWQDVTLTRDGGPNLITSATTLTSADNMNFTLGGNLASLTSYAGTYALSFNTAGFADAYGNTVPTPISQSWVLDAINANPSDAIRIGHNASANVLDVFLNTGSSTPTYSVNVAAFPALFLNGASGATFTLQADLAGIPLTIASGASVTATAPQHLGVLLISGAGKLALAAGGTNSLTVSGLSIDATARLDLNDHDLYWLTANPATDYTALWNYLASGRNSGSWNGTGIDSSAAYAQYLSYGNEYTGLALAPSSATLHVKYTVAGDLNLDGTVDIRDFRLFDLSYILGGSGYTAGDVDYSGSIGSGDYTIINRNFPRPGLASLISPPMDTLTADSTAPSTPPAAPITTDSTSVAPASTPALPFNPAPAVAPSAVLASSVVPASGTQNDAATPPAPPLLPLEPFAFALHAIFPSSTAGLEDDTNPGNDTPDPKREVRTIRIVQLPQLKEVLPFANRRIDPTGAA